MKLDTRRLINKTIAVTTLFCMTAQPTLAALLNLASVPLFIGANIPPQVMLTITKDQQLFKKAYNDYSDLDNDGVLETTYKHGIDYYGYFDSKKCYSYNTGTNRFEPFGITANKYCEGANAGQWSGNFLNWVAMTRMDAVRKLLYGGLRSTDGSTTTVLERAYLPTDAHSYTKYYAGQIDPNTGAVIDNDIHKLTPFTGIPATPPVSTSASPHSTTTGSKTFNTATAGYQIGHQVRITATAGAAAGQTLTGHITAIAAGTSITVQVDACSVTPCPGNNGTAWNIANVTMTGLTFCNTTLGGTGALGTGSIGSPQNRSQTNTNPPLIRVASGNYALWASNERWQCYFQEETTSPGRSTSLGGTRSSGNRSGFSGLFAGGFEPTRAANGLGSIDYVARVQACVSTLLGSERCKQYPNGNYKPIGLLQEYGDVSLIHFGLMTGSFNKNVSGGVLRKNVGPFTNEVNLTTDGTFVTPAGGGIVNTLNRLRIYGYNYDDGTYLGGGGDNCSFQLVNISEGSCRSWGNPISEIYYESLRYFAGTTAPTPAFSANDSSLISGLTTATWPTTTTQVLNSNNYCAPLNVLVFNASVSTNEDDGQIPTGLSVINSTQSAVQLTNTVGANEPGAEAVIAANQFFFGKVAGAAVGSPGFELCSAKNPNANGLGDVIGICPEGPTLGGTYHIAGLAYHARINRIRTDITGVPSTDTKALKVTTYGISLATNVPTIPIRLLGETNPRAILQPIYRLQVGAGLGGGALVDMKIVSQTVTATSSKGSLYLNWEDSEQGGDYDQDLWGIMSWCMQTGSDTTSCPGQPANTISVTTKPIAESTVSPQGFGYVINGTTQDGPHFHSGIENFSFIDPTNITVTPAGFTNASGGCDTCNVGDPPTTAVYTLSGAPTALNLRDPLYYAAKYGAFVDSNGNNLPDLQSEWDSKLGNGVAGQDGVPDTYFLVTNPLGLEAALDRAFITILSNASASSVATNSTSLQTGTTIYQARFNANDWSGQVLAFPVQPDGTIATTPSWDAGQVINSQSPNDRVILTFNDTATVRDGVAFRWPSNPASPGSTDISPALIANLDTSPSTSVTDGRGEQRLNYLRGDASQEGATVVSFRQRPTSKLGDIVNSNPNFVSIPSANILDPTYAQFRLDNASRPAMIYVGGNDGMLHGFDAATGQEKLAYIPSKTFPHLNKLTSKTYVHRYYVDGSPEIADAFFGGQWRTVLVSGMAAGGQGLFALDITNPALFTESNAGSVVLWEFNDSDDRDLGYVFGQPAIRKMANGKWAAIVSGGYNNSEGDGNASTTGNAVLFIIFLDGPSGPNRTWVAGTDYIKIDTGVGTTGTPNGLAPPFPADVNADGVVDFVYTGDQRGNLWKFDLRSTTAANWTSSSNRVILFTARDASSNAQPITSQAEGTLHPTGQGFIITFGTGKYLEPTDPNSPYLTQSFYGIWDKNDANPISGQTVITGRNQLLTQTITSVVSGSNTFRVVSTNTATWSTDTTPPAANDSPSRHMGWFMDFPSSTTTGERSVFRPILTAGRLIFTTLLPSASTCQFGGTSFLMVVDPATGARIDGAVLDVDANGQLNNQDTVVSGGSNVFVSGVQSTIGITPTPTIIKATGSAGGSGSAGNLIFGTGGPLVADVGFLMAYALAAGSSGGNASTMIGLGSAGGRVSWREVLTD
jgi:type IV pilus assembly protein PilY1